MARSMGIPARIDEVTGKVQLMGDEGAVDVNFEAMEQASAPTGKFIARYTPIKSLADPIIYSFITINPGITVNINDHRQWLSRGLRIINI